jgi:hypothetical protein
MGNGLYLPALDSKERCSGRNEEEALRMGTTQLKSASPLLITAARLASLLTIGFPAAAQHAGLQEHLAEIKAASAQNKQRLATYTWQEQDTISLKGEVKKRESFQVRMGADGKPVKTPLNRGEVQQAQQAGGRRGGGRLRERIVENKKEEYREYAQQIAALAHSYVPPDSAKLQEAFQQGNVKMGQGTAPTQVQILITNYVKPNDSMTLTFDRSAKAIQSVQIASYLDSPSDAVRIAVQFAKLPDGTNHVATMVLEGVSKQMKVNISNSNYAKL